jgi:hypothetical protein
MTWGKFFWALLGAVVVGSVVVGVLYRYVVPALLP